MKQIFRCEYCDKLGTEEELLKHEEDCIHNYTKRSCLTCKNRGKLGLNNFACTLGKPVAEGHYYQYCKTYERDEKDYTTRNPWTMNSLFGGIFG